MASYYDYEDKLLAVSPNILIAVDDDNVGEMYVYDMEYEYTYILNGMTASSLVDYFYDTDQAYLSEEIQEAMMGMVINRGTH